MTGLEFMQSIVNGERPYSNMGNTIPMKIIKVELGKALLEVKADERHLNVGGAVHGGFAATVIDSLTGVAVLSSLDRIKRVGTIDLQVKLLRPIPVHETMIGEASLINISRTLAVAEAYIKNKEGKIFAYGNATYAIPREK